MKGQPWTTLFRAPQMRAASGVWLEAFSKRDAQAMLIAVPWTLALATFAFFLSLYIIEASIPSALETVELVKSGTYYVLAFICASYIFVAILFERPSGCCRKGSSRRTLEGWLAMLPVVICCAMSVVYARCTHSLPDASERMPVLHGSLAFRAAATTEFLLQVGWLWAAAGLRCQDTQGVPRWKRLCFLALISLWCLTWCGPKDVHKNVNLNDNAFVLAGYSSRIFLFFYCIMRVCRKCTGHCRCCCCCKVCREDWTVGNSLPCTPGHDRLRYILYCLLTRPPFLLLVNLPLGYPLAVLAPFASSVRCCMVLLVAFSLRPAPPASVTEHSLEVDTRENFDLELALRLCDFSCETYLGAAAPLAVEVSGCGHQELNGKYYQDGRDKSGVAAYVRCLSGAAGNDRKAHLCHRAEQGTWEVFVLPATVSSVELADTALEPLVYAKDEGARTPNQVEGLWFEVHGDQHLSNTNLRVESLSPVLRTLERSGGCPELDVRWLLVEIPGGLAQRAKASVGRPLDDDKEDPEVTTGASSGDGDKVHGQRHPRHEQDVSIVVAFRGTNSVKNMVTDARISLQPLSLEYSSFAGGGPTGSEPVCFDLKPQVLAKLREKEDFQWANNPAVSSSSTSFREAVAPLRALGVSPRELEAGEQGTAGPSGCGFLQRLARCCMCLFFPFLPPSDFEEDDEELSLEALDRVRVHSGFAEAYAAVRDEVMARLKERLVYWQSEGRSVNLYVTGHSMGGAIAKLFALDVAAAPSDEVDCRGLPRRSPPVVYSFGGPRLGNAAFRSIYNVLVPETFRVVASRDMVSTLPPSISYRQLGREVWVDNAGELTYVMSWALRHILPARDNVWDHPLLTYYRLLNRAFQRKTGRSYQSEFGGESDVREALEAKPLSS
eukprot:TRINITY_DN20744_c0_g1_i3.p1 TRINITY_DN20744_c0_g1~~TRINITY_DN20744_c0_g1_i3.p1  ORF type:complete len:892 (-),score=131.77 TRINITY_DN20744_c0_g1_i3:93-2768(-)